MPQSNAKKSQNGRRQVKEIYSRSLLKSELLIKQACRDETCSLIFFNSMIYHALRANVLSTVLRKYQKTNLYIYIYT